MYGDIMKSKPLAIDLFCGAGGMSEGILQAGFHIIYSNDISEDAMKTYVNRHAQLGLIHGKNTFASCKDIRELNAQEIYNSISKIQDFKDNKVKIEAIFGGPPCQGFSRAGKRNSSDPRNQLFKEYIRIINELRPNYVVMENVEGFLDTIFENFVGLDGEKYKKNKVPNILMREFSKIGYKVLKPKVLNAEDYGVPQSRKRVIFIAFLPNVSAPLYPIKSEAKKITLADAIFDLTDSSFKSGYVNDCIYGRTKTIYGDNVKYDVDYKLNNELSTHSKLIYERFSLFKEGETTSDLRKRIKTEGNDL